MSGLRQLCGAVSALLTVCTLSGMAAGTSGAAGAPADYDIRLGEISLDFTGRLSLAYDTNVHRSTSAAGPRDRGAVGEAGLGLRLYWPVNADFIVDSRFYFGYEGTLDDNELRGLIVDVVDADTLNMSLRLSDRSRLNLRDRLAVAVDTVELATEENSGDLRLLDNAATLEYDIELSSVYRASVALERGDVRSIGGDRLVRRDKGINGVSGVWTWQMNQTQALSLYGSWREHRYRKALNNDAQVAEGGLEFARELGTLSQFRSRLGYQRLSFDDAGTPAGRRHAGGPTASAELQMTRPSGLQYQLEALYHRRVSPQTGVNYSDDLRVVCGLAWEPRPRWRISPKLQWLLSDEDGTVGERSNVYAGELRLRRQLGERSALEAWYRRVVRISDGAGGFARDLLTMAYAFDF